uniref:SFRICE_014485 n=1 Tax=Spodoptera frugiperda TaxID=7108 RepID=A0A2H1V8Z0_SPOFR
MFALRTLAFIFILHTSFANKNTIPVFLLDHDQVMSHVQVDPNPFSKLTKTNFADIVKDSRRRADATIIFVEDSFSTEDISTKDRLGTPYANLRSGLMANKVKYFPSVIEPYKLLSQMFQPRENNVYYLSSRNKFQVMNNFKYIYVYFQDGPYTNETRAQILRRHDAIIREVIFIVRQLKTGPVVAYYTGKLNPIVVEKSDSSMRSMDPPPRKKGVLVASSGALFRLFGVHAASPTRRALFDEPPRVSEETFTRRTLSTRVSYPVFDLEFAFSFRDDGWRWDHIAIYEGGEEVGRTDMNISVPWNYSYYCPEPISIFNTRDGSSLTISQYQIQPREIFSLRKRGSGREGDDEDTTEADDSAAPEVIATTASEGDGTGEGSGEGSGEGGSGGTGGSKASNVTFNKMVHCGPYFTTTILSSLMIVFFCLSIALYGVVTLFNCASNDRYEDPNSKPLTHDLLH